LDVSDYINYNDSVTYTSAWGYSFIINYGYQITITDQIIIVPYLGFSRTFFNTFFIDNFQSIIDFQNIPLYRNSINFDNNTLSLDIGTRILIPIGDCPQSYCGIDASFGNSLKSQWEANKVNLNNRPKINPSGLKIGLIIIFMMSKG
jgi:hypothetical protein